MTFLLSFDRAAGGAVSGMQRCSGSQTSTASMDENRPENPAGEI